MQKEAGCFVILAAILLPMLINKVSDFLPQLNLFEAGAIGIFIYAVIYLILQRLFGEPFDE